MGKNNVNAMLIQPFINYNFPHGWYLASSPIITANWIGASDNRWTLPIGGGFGKIFKFDHKFPPINLQLQAFDNVVRPHQGAPTGSCASRCSFYFRDKENRP